MTTNNWDYKELGFDSVDEMNASIERVKAEQGMTPRELAQERLKRAAEINDRGGFDFALLEQGARLEQLDKVVKYKLREDANKLVLEAERKENAEFMAQFADYVESKNRKEAEAEFIKQKEKAEAELQKEVYGRWGVTTDIQAEVDESYRRMLGK